MANESGEGAPGGGSTDTRAPAPAETVRATLRDYAGRSILRGLGMDETDRGLEFRFHYLGPRPHRLIFDPRDDTLTWDGILPDAGSGSAVAEDIGKFLRSRADDDLPAHRRLDPERAAVELADRDGRSVVVLRILDGDHEYAVRKLMNLVNEIWIRLNDAHQRYMWKAFDAPME